MPGMKISVGYGSDRRGSGAKGMYGGRSTGKKLMNGGFNFQPTVDYTDISEDKWVSIFGTAGMPKWKKELIDSGESLDD